MSRRKTDAERLAEAIADEEKMMAELAEERRQFKSVVNLMENELADRPLAEVLACLLRGEYEWMKMT